MGEISFLQASSRKASSDDFDDLLFGRNLIVAGEAQSAGEDVRAHIGALAVETVVGVGSSVAVARDEWVHPVHRLHMHGFSTAVSLLYTIYCSLCVYLHTIYRFPTTQPISLQPTFG